ncbi:MAG: hypothetical protein ACTSQ7_09035 [Alphaproteobacteria bacterium]
MAWSIDCSITRGLAGAGGLEFLDCLGLLGDRRIVAVDLGLSDRGLGLVLLYDGGLLLDLALLVADAPFDSVHQNHQAFAVSGALRVVQAEALLGGQNPLAQFLDTSHDKTLPQARSTPRKIPAK